MPGPVPLPDLPALVRTPLITVYRTVRGTIRGGRAVATAVTALPGLASALTGLRDAAAHLEQLATFTAGELPEAVYQLETIGEQLDAVREQLTAIALQLAALRPVTSTPAPDCTAHSPTAVSSHRGRAPRLSPGKPRTGCRPPS